MIGAIQRYRSNQPTRAEGPGSQPGVATTTGGAFNAGNAPAQNAPQ